MGMRRSGVDWEGSKYNRGTEGTGVQAKETEQDNKAESMNAIVVSVYGSEMCGHCRQQK